MPLAAAAACAPHPPVHLDLQAGLQVFRSLRNVESMRLYFSSSGGSHFLVVQFTCKHGG